MFTINQKSVQTQIYLSQFSAHPWAPPKFLRLGWCSLRKPRAALSPPNSSQLWHESEMSLMTNFANCFIPLTVKLTFQPSSLAMINTSEMSGVVHTSPSYCSGLSSGFRTHLLPLEVSFEPVIAGNLFKQRFWTVSDHVKPAETDWNPGELLELQIHP